MRKNIPNMRRLGLCLFIAFCLPIVVQAEDVVVADANGNRLKYSYSGATGNATFMGIDAYSTNASTAGMIIIADQVTDGNGKVHNVTAVGSDLTNREALVSVTIGKNVTSVGNWAFSNCHKIRTFIVNAVGLGSWGSYWNSGMDSVQTMSLDMKTIPDRFYYNVKTLTKLTIGNNVETIGSSAFSGTGLTSVTLGTNVSSLGRYCFQNCANLAKFTYNNKLTAIPDQCFEGTGITEMTIPDIVTSIGSSAFNECSRLASITIGKGVTSVGGWAFSNCHKIRTFVVNAVDLGSWGSYWNSGMDSVQTMSLDMKTIPDRFYDNVKTLTKLTLGTHVETIGHNAFQSTSLTNLIIGNNVTKIDYGAFDNCSSLTSVKFNNKLTTIGENAFRKCNLKSLDIPDNVITLGTRAFQSNENLKTVNIGNGVSTIGGWCFEWCYALTDVTLGTSLTSFGSLVFQFDEKISSITFLGTVPPDGFNAEQSRSIAVLYVPAGFGPTYREKYKNYRIVEQGSKIDFTMTTTAGGQVQYFVEQQGSASNALSLKVNGFINGTDIDYIHGELYSLNKLDLSGAKIVSGGDSYHVWEINNGTPNQISWQGSYETENNVIGDWMFYYMPFLKTLLLPSGATKMGAHAVQYCQHLSELTLPTGLTEIGEQAFRQTAITQITVPSKVKVIPNEMCYDCSQLKKLVLPNGVTSIGTSAFSECDSLTSITIPTALQTIGNYAFYNAPKLATPLVFPSSLTSIGERAFEFGNLIPSVQFNQGLKSIGYAAFDDCFVMTMSSLPSSLTSIGGYAFEDCRAITEVTLPAAIKDVQLGTFMRCTALTKVVLASGTTAIRHDAFNGCENLTNCNINQSSLTILEHNAFSNTAFTKVTLPNSLTSVDFSVFQDCRNLTSINVPTGIDYVPARFVQNCPLLTTVTMHNGIRTVKDNAFNACVALEKITLNNNITYIDQYAFYQCEKLKLEKLPSKIENLHYSAFNGCKAITKMTLPATLKMLNNSAFDDSGLQEVTLTAVPETFGNYVFNNCADLVKVTLPNDLRDLPNYTFQNCTKLTTIVLPDSLRRIGHATFYNSGLLRIELPQVLQTIDDYAFANTQLSSFRLPDSFTDDLGAYALQNCKRLKTVYLGRNQDYAQISSFTCLQGCDSLQLLRIYAGAPPKCNSYYMSYRKNCVLEVPEDALSLYQAADVWKEFKEIRSFYTGDVLADEDFAVMKLIYQQLDGAHWKNPWNLENNHRSVGKWQGVTFDGDYIKGIDLSAQGLKGELKNDIFTLAHLTTLNLSNNAISGNLGKLLPELFSGSRLKEVYLWGNKLSGDLYPFASKLPELTKIDVSYNQLTAISKPLSQSLLTRDNLLYGGQFIDYATKQPVVTKDNPAIQVTVGVPFDYEFNSLQTYRHNYQDYQLVENYLQYIYKSGNSITNGQTGLRRADANSEWNITTSGGEYFKAPKGVPVAFSAYNWNYYRPLNYNPSIFIFDWTDGDANADQIVDVSDLQSIIYFAMYDTRSEELPFNFSAADANIDDIIDVRDIVGSVNYILDQDEAAVAPIHLYKKVSPVVINHLLVDGGNLVLANAEPVAALQIFVSGASARELKLNPELRQKFSVSMRDLADGVRLLVYSAQGNTLPAGDNMLLTDLPDGASITSVRLVDSKAKHLGVDIQGEATNIEAMGISNTIADVFDLQGRRLGDWDTLPSGIYIINVNGKQMKVKK